MMHENKLCADVAGKSHLVGNEHQRHAVARKLLDDAEPFAHELRVER
jgi:hypothetical protein